MKKILMFINSLMACGKCFGNGTTEETDGGTAECRNCEGKGYIR